MSTHAERIDALVSMADEQFELALAQRSGRYADWGYSAETSADLYRRAWQAERLRAEANECDIWANNGMRERRIALFARLEALLAEAGV